MNTSTKNRFSIMFLVVISLVFVTLLSFKDKSNDNLKTFKPARVVKYSKHLKPLTFSANLDNIYYYNSKELYLDLDVKAEDVQEFSGRTPLNISIVIDKSGSMSGKNKLDFVKKAVEYIIDDLNYDDYVSIVTYDDNVTTVYASSKVEDKERLKEEVKKIMSGGFTNLSGGMNQGFEQVEKTFKRGYVNRVMLLSDGLANRGITDRL
jgi:Ca-activated chloride channel homolog